MPLEYPEIHKNALKILEKRYFWTKSNGTLENIDDLFLRTSVKIGSAESLFLGSQVTVDEAVNRFFEMQRSLRFIPNTPTLINAGRERGQLAACFVLPMGDSMDEIMESIKKQALVQKSGGGTGFNFGCIRERGAPIKSTGMKAVGPIPIIKLMNYMMSEFIIQGGVRHGANMGVLPDDHPDLLEFITFKEKDGSCASFNISIAVSDKFMMAVKTDGLWDLHSRVDGSVVATHRARELFDMIAEYAWQTGDPGVLFIDSANADNPTPHLGRLQATNPCGEQWLLPNEACTLGHLNLSKYWHPNELSAHNELSTHCKLSDHWVDNFNWSLFGQDIKWAVRFLDNVIEVNHYATPEIEQMHRYTNRKIGLGVMGLADLLILAGVPYDSDMALDIGNTIAEHFRNYADGASSDLARERGSFGAFEGSAVAQKFAAMRNACRCTVAPTGSTAILANSSTGIEPIFALILKREQAGMEMYEIHPLFEKYLMSRDNDARTRIINYYFKHNSIQGCPDVAENIQRLYVQANDVDVGSHIKMQAQWQEHIDNSISKTINMAHCATVGDVKSAYLMAWEEGCKGITIYRDGCRAGQALSIASSEIKHDMLPDTQVPLCKECGEILDVGGGCETCKNCGFAACNV